MKWQRNENKDNNEHTLRVLIIQEGYTDLGWANDGKEFTHKNSISRDIDCSLYSYRGSNMVYIDDVHKEILHVDMSD